MATLPVELRRRPPPQALIWAIRPFGPGARVTALRRLRAGTSSAVHALTVTDRQGLRHRVVLRRFVLPWFAEEPDTAAREAHVLNALEDSGIPAPRLLAVDPDGSECDVAAILMTLVPGRLDLDPADPRAYVRQLAAVLPALHALPLPAGVQSYYPYFAGDGGVPLRPWVRKPEVWRTAEAIVQGPWPETPRAFIHRDYHPGNILWGRGRITGITDWPNASIGPPGIDVAHCRHNLAALFGLRVAADFRSAYEAEAGVEHHPFWDLLSAIDGGTTPSATQWRDAGRNDLTDALVLRRVEAYVESLVRELC